MTVLLPSYPIGLPTYSINVSSNGSESKLISFDFSDKPFQGTGDQLLSSPEPTVLVANPYDNSGLNVSLISVSPSTKSVEVEVSAVDGNVPGTYYLVTCRANTTLGSVFIVVIVVVITGT